MHLTVILLNIFFLFACLTFLIMLKIKFLKSNKVSNDLVGFISKSSEILDKYEKKQEVIQLRNSIKLYSLIRIVLNMDSPDLISFFKYNYNQYDNNHELNFIFTVDSNGFALQHTYLDEKIIFMELSKIIKSKNIDYELSHVYLDDIKNDYNYFYEATLKRNLNKVYFKNIYNSNNEPIGLILLGYKDKNHNILDDDKIELCRILDETKHFL